MPSDDFYAIRLVKHSPLAGRLRLAMQGPVAAMLRRGRISAWRTIGSPDGTAIDTWLLGARDSQGNAVRARGTALLIHGLWDAKAHLLGPARHIAAAGFDVVLADLRSHGRSGGTFCTFGSREKHDLLAVMDSLTAEGLIGGPRYVMGFSMGGGTAVQYAALDPQCRGVLAMAPVASARLIMTRLLLVFSPFMGRSRMDRVIGRAGELAGFCVEAASAIDAASQLRCPLSVVHGMLDGTVPMSHGRLVYEAARAPRRLTLVPWAGHNSLMLGRGAWIARQISQFAQGQV